MKRVINKFLKRPYSNSRSGKIFKTPPLYFFNIMPKFIDNYINEKHIMNVLQAPTGTCKFLFSVLLGEYLKFKSKLILIPKVSLNDQHKLDLQHWINDGFIEDNWNTNTLQTIYYLIKKIEAFKDLSEEEKVKINELTAVEYIVLDELHMYSKGSTSYGDDDEDVNKMLPTILNFCREKGSLKYVLGTSATAKNVRSIYDWANIDIKFKQLYTIIVGEDELLKDGLVPNLDVNGIFCGTDIKFSDKQDIIDVIDGNPTDLEKSVEQLNQQYFVSGNTVDNALENVIDAGIYSSKKDVFKEHFSTATQLYSAIRMFIRNRIRTSVATEILDRKTKFKDEVFVSLTYSPTCEDADYCNDFYNSNSKVIKSISWHGNSKTYKKFKGDANALKEWIKLPSVDVKHISLVGMLGEGDDMDFVNYVSDCCFNPNELDRPIQRRGRIRKNDVWENKFGYSGVWRILWDPFNQKKLNKGTDIFDYAKKMFEKYNIPGLSQEKLLEMLTQLANAQASINEAINDDDGDVTIDLDTNLDFDIDWQPGDEGADWEPVDEDDDLTEFDLGGTVGFHNVWVSKVEGSPNTLTINHKDFLLTQPYFTEKRAFKLLRDLGKVLDKEDA